MRTFDVVDGEPLRSPNGQSSLAGQDSGPDVWPTPKEPTAVARRFVANSFSYCEVPTLRHWRGGFYQWQRSHWRKVEDRKISAHIYDELEHAKFVNNKGETEPWR